jgi:outer membrane usher protein
MSAAAWADPGLRPALLDVTLNGARGDEPILLLRDDSGALYASAQMFERWRLRTPPETPVRYEGNLYYRLGGLPGLQVRLSEADQAVTVDAPPNLFEIQRASLASDEALPMTPSASGLFLTYDLLLEHARGRDDASGAFETGVFTRRGVGSASFIAGAGSNGARLVRLETNWAIENPSSATSLTIGDSISIAGPGTSPARFAGLHYFRNYAMRPGFITMPLPAAAGSAAVPSVVDVYVNNVLESSRNVAPGPFELTNIPVQSGGGNVRVVVRDLLGREVVTEQNYYAATQLLRRGLHDFSWEVGFVRQDFGRRSNGYGAFMVSTTHRYGLSNSLTAEATLQASGARQNAGTALITALGFGQAAASASISRGERGTGYRIAASLERHASHLSFGLLSEHQSAAYGFIGNPDDYRPPRLTVQGYADLALDEASVGINLLFRSLRNVPSETVVGISGSFRLGAFGQVQLYARRAMIGAGETSVGANMTFALGGRRSTSVSSEYRGGRMTGEISFQDNPPAGVGGSFRSTASIGAVRRTEAAYSYNLPMATVGAQLARSSGGIGIRLSAAGSIGLNGGNAFASRTLGGSFATVLVDGYPGVRVYADDRLVGVTRADGSLTVPGLRPFEANQIRIDESDLPLDAHFDSNDILIRPSARTGTIVRFAVREERGVLMHVRREDGRNLPAGATVRTAAGATFVTASDGEVYATGLAGTQVLMASWDGGTCAFTATVPDNRDPQPRLEGLVCRTGDGS